MKSAFAAWRIGGVGLASLCLVLFSTDSFARSVWDTTIVHPLPTGNPVANCLLGSNTCAGSPPLHLGIDLKVAATTEVKAMCGGIVKDNYSNADNVWDTRIIVEHDCGGHFRKIYGYYGHTHSTLNAGTEVKAGAVIGKVMMWRDKDANGKYFDAPGNSHLHMGVAYQYYTDHWGYRTSIDGWIDFRTIVNRSSVRPTARLPAEGSATGISVPFSWDTVTGATSYRIVVSQDANPLRNFDNYTRACNGVNNGGSACWTNAEPITSTSYTRSFNANTTYYWVVRSNDSDWSEIGSFRTGSGVGVTTWSSGAYRDNETLTQVLSIPGATRLRVTVSGQTESGYDFLSILDGNNATVQKLSGAINKSFTVRGDTVTVKLVSDFTITASGVTVNVARADGEVSPAEEALGQCYAKYSIYFGQKVGSPYICYSSFTCQATTGPATHMAVETDLAHNLLFYYWGSGWGNLGLHNCQ